MIAPFPLQCEEILFIATEAGKHGTQAPYFKIE